MGSRRSTQCHPICSAVFPVTFNEPIQCRNHLVTGINTEIHRSEDLDCGLLGYETVHIGRSPTFRRYLLSSSSGQNCWGCSRPTFCCNVSNHLPTGLNSYLPQEHTVKIITITHQNFNHITPTINFIPSSWENLKLYLCELQN